MYTNNYLSLGKEVFLSNKEKLSKTYFENQANYYIETLVTGKAHITSARNYYSSKRDALDFEYLEDIYGMQNPIDLSFTNIIKPRVDALIGLSLMTEPNFMVQYTDRETIRAVEKEKLEGILKELTSEVGRAVKEDNLVKKQQPDAKQQQSTEPDLGTKKWLTDLTEKYGSDFESGYTIAAQHLIRLIETDSEIDLSNVKKELARNYFITGEAYTRDLYKGDGKDPKKESCMPEYVYTNRAATERDLKETSAVVYKRQVTPHQVLKELGDRITKADAEKMFQTYSSLNSYFDIPYGALDANIEMDSGASLDTMFMKTGYSNDTPGAIQELVDLYHVEWLASTRIPNGKGGYVYREDRYEAYRVGAEIFIGTRRCEEAPRTKDQPWKTSLSYSGMINVSGGTTTYSMVNNMRELQDLYDIMMFFRNNNVANSGASGSRVNVAAIPKALGSKFMDRLTKWMTMRKQGVELIDVTEEGSSLFQHYGDFDSSVRPDSINAVNAILESLTLQADIISGVPRQMLGIIEERDAVENVRVGINQVSVLSLEMFRDVDRCLNRGVQKTLDNYKWAYRKKAKEGVYKNGMAMVPFIISPKHTSSTDHKVSVISSGIENAKLVKVINLAKEFASAGAIDFDILVKVINKKSVAEIEQALDKALKAKKEEMMSIGQLQQQLDEANKVINQLEAEIARLENNKAKNEEARLTLDKQVAADNKELKFKELDIKSKDIINKKDKADKDVALGTATVELEKEQLLFDGGGNSQEVKNY